MRQLGRRLEASSVTDIDLTNHDFGKSKCDAVNVGDRLAVERVLSVYPVRHLRGRRRQSMCEQILSHIHHSITLALLLASQSACI